MLAMVRSRRAWVYVLSVAALLVPAGGIAYLGAVSYRDERGAVSAQNERQRQAALGIASWISRAVDDALEATERSAVAGSRTVAAPLARHWFWVDGDQRLRVPHSAPPERDPGGGMERGASCAGGRLEDCVHELATRQSRIARLAAAQRAEAGASWVEARRQYGPLAAFADTGPSALLGLARVLARLEDSHASSADGDRVAYGLRRRSDSAGPLAPISRSLGQEPDAPGSARSPLAELERRFGDRSFEGVPVRLVVATLRADASGPAAAAALTAVANDVLAGT